MKLLFLLLLIYFCEATDPPYRYTSISRLPFDETCKWHYPEQCDTLPVYLSKKKYEVEFTINRPSKQDGKLLMELEYREDLLILCPNNGPAVRLLEGQCSWKNPLSKNMDNFLDRFKCSFSVEFQKKKLQENCQESIKLSEIGFDFITDDTLKRIDIVKYCFDPDTGRNYYTTHKIFGGLKFDENSEGRTITFSDPKMEALYYNHRQQHIALVGEYSMETTLTLYGSVHTEDYLIPVRLIPPEDIILNVEKIICDDPDTLILMWKSVYTKQWVQVEQLVREAASKMDDQIYVTTGTHSEKQTDEREDHWEIGGRPMTTFVYKMMAWKGFCVVFVVSNKRGGSQNVCSDVCKIEGWPVLEGVSCYFLDELKKDIPGIILPSIDKCKPLKYPTKEPIN